MNEKFTKSLLRLYEKMQTNHVGLFTTNSVALKKKSSQKLVFQWNSLKNNKFIECEKIYYSIWFISVGSLVLFIKSSLVCVFLASMCEFGCVIYQSIIARHNTGAKDLNLQKILVLMNFSWNLRLKVRKWFVSFFTCLYNDKSLLN